MAFLTDLIGADAMGAAGISIPFPQRELHVVGNLPVPTQPPEKVASRQ